MIKSQVVISETINGKEIFSFSPSNVSWGEMFDYSCMLRKLCIDKMTEAHEKESQPAQAISCCQEQVCTDAVI
jgi:hypothetical protein